MFIHFPQERTIDEIRLEKEVRERLVILPFQPFLDIGIELYVLGSLSCAATYSNDAEVHGWGEECKKAETSDNNCFMWCSKPADPNTIGGLLAWLKSCPRCGLWSKKHSKIYFGEELLTDYFD